MSGVVDWLQHGKERRAMIADYIEECKEAQVAVSLGLTPYSYHDHVSSLRTKYQAKGLCSDDIAKADKQLTLLHLE